MCVVLFILLLSCLVRHKTLFFIFIVSWIWNSKNIYCIWCSFFVPLFEITQNQHNTHESALYSLFIFYVRYVFYIFINRLNWKYWRIFDGNVALKWLKRRMNNLKWWRWGINMCSISTKVTRFQTCSRVSKWNDRWIIIVKASHKTKLNCELNNMTGKKTQTQNKITNKILKMFKELHTKNK